MGSHKPTLFIPIQDREWFVPSRNEAEQRNELKHDIFVTKENPARSNIDGEKAPSSHRHPRNPVGTTSQILVVRVVVSSLYNTTEGKRCLRLLRPAGIYRAPPLCILDRPASTTGGSLFVGDMQTYH